ncbi:MAG TPA: hypothetical protein VM554_14220 [Acidisarcina sp.]|nr:hypothetical protein [Acidisarcina sp.]
MRSLSCKMRPWFAIFAVLVLLVVGAQAAAAQEPVGDKHDANPAAQATAAAPEKDLRQAQIQADTNRLLQLAQELKLEVSKSNKDILSLAVIKKADEIEKLAKSLKERIRAQ